MSLHELAYLSTATRLLSDDELDGLLAQARAKNAELGVTGMLLYKDKSFLQVIEGDRDTLEGLYRTIRQDMRHQNVRQLFFRPLAARNFADWQMGFARLDGGDPPEGWSALMKDGAKADSLSLPERSSLAYTLLLTFRKLS